MKQLFVLLVALMMVFSLAACDNDSSDASRNDDQGGADIENIDFAAIMSGNGGTDVVWGKQDAATKQAIIDEARKDGVDVSFGADGSMTVVDADGTNVVQKPDGTWLIKDADGGEGQLGGDWPNNEFTALVPKPDFELFGASTEAESFTVAFTNASIEQLKDYAAKVKAAGFDINEEVEDQELMGVVIYSFTAENADGYTVEITSAAGTNAMTISK